MLKSTNHGPMVLKLCVISIFQGCYTNVVSAVL